MSNNTGCPSKDRTWLKYYKDKAEEEANVIPNGKTVWDVIEESLLKNIDIPAIEYFGRKITRKELINNVYTWARAFKALGVEENEIVAYYGPFLPEVCYMVFALNTIGACPYFLKLAISPEALAEETKECKVAIVFDQMWSNVSAEFSKDRFEKIIIVRITDSMPFPKKQLVSVLSGLKAKVTIPKNNKFIYAPAAEKRSVDYIEEIKVPYVPERNAFITSSSGTTVGGVVKGCIATNETTLAQLIMSRVSEFNYFVGDRCLNHFPPTASTSLFLLYFAPLYNGETVIIDPRVSENDFYNQMTKYRPNQAVNTGSAWEAFFQRVEKEMSSGKCFDFSFAKGWSVGGEGTSPDKYQKWNSLMKLAGNDTGLYIGYGSSEVFSAATAEKNNARHVYKKGIMSVGIPYAGITVGVFDEIGKELGYNQRGELWIRSKSAMKGYYNKPELTAQTKVDGWIHTGDLAEIDENGFIYIWGRVNDSIVLSNGRKVYLFDLANKIKELECISDAVVLKKPVENEPLNLVAHIVWSDEVEDDEKKAHLIRITQMIKQYEPNLNLNTFAFHNIMLPYSPTTLKTDKNRMSKQLDGYVKVTGSEISTYTFTKTD